MSGVFINIDSKRLISISQPASQRAALQLTLACACTMQAQAPHPARFRWEGPMTAIVTSLTSPVAYAIGLIGLVVSVLLFAGARRLGRQHSR